MTFADFDALSFDCYGTLIDWEAGILAALRPWADRQGLGLTDEEFLLAFSARESAAEAEHPNAIYPEILARSMRGVAAGLGGITDAEAEAFGASVPAWPAFPDSTDALERLAKRYKLIILSNVDRRSFAGSNRRLGVTFTSILTAQDIGSYKPSPRNSRRCWRSETVSASPRRLSTWPRASSTTMSRPRPPASRPSGSTAVRTTRAGGATPEPEAPVTPDWTFGSMAAFPTPSTPRAGSVRRLACGAPLMGDLLAAALAGASVDKAVLDLRPDYTAVLLVGEGLPGGPTDEQSDAWLREAERAVAGRLAGAGPEDRPTVALWREAYRAFGAKPQRTRNSLEALMRRAADGLPRIDRLTDLYNAVSLLHEVPVGGEDLDHYAGAPRLLRAAGTEPFETTADGEAVIEHPEPGEVIWADDAGVTCRRWNWRRCTRTRLTPDTTRALFIIDALGPDAATTAEAAGDDIERRLRLLSPSARIARRRLGTGGA
ncbi:MAG: phenylalanine--tRNA ligase beta subunit-related protein [Chloroflexota bacterium]